MSKAEQAAQMRDRDGASIHEIMLRFGWSRKTAQDQVSRGRRYKAFLAHRNEVDRASRAQGAGAKRRAARTAAKLARDAEIAAFVRSGALVSEAAKRFAVSSPTVSRACHALGVKASELQSCVDRKLSVIANAQRRSWADPVRRARRIERLRSTTSGGFQNSKA